MSAYIVDDDTYTSLYKYLCASEFYCVTYEDVNSESRKDRIIQFITELREANYHSVNTRYRETATTPKWVANPSADTFSDIQAFKSMHCIEYQSCEFEEWYSTRAWAALQEACNHAAYRILQKTKEWETSLWG